MSEGATKGLKGLIRAAGAGNDLALTPDGAKRPQGRPEARAELQRMSAEIEPDLKPRTPRLNRGEA
ncbi:MAG TPA: hypothetical protein DC060_20715 [Gemmatimonadetes bacterium]|nr:hypothetical protein [Gemmatimonadota bacterium]